MFYQLPLTVITSMSINKQDSADRVSGAVTQAAPWRPSPDTQGIVQRTTLTREEAIHRSAERWGLASVEPHHRRVYSFCKVKLAGGGYNDFLPGFRWPMCATVFWRNAYICYLFSDRLAEFSHYRKGITFWCHPHHNRRDSTEEQHQQSQE